MLFIVRLAISFYRLTLGCSYLQILKFDGIFLHLEAVAYLPFLGCFDCCPVGSLRHSLCCWRPSCSFLDWACKTRRRTQIRLRRASHHSFTPHIERDQNLPFPCFSDWCRPVQDSLPRFVPFRWSGSFRVNCPCRIYLAHGRQDSNYFSFFSIFFSLWWGGWVGCLSDPRTTDSRLCSWHCEGSSFWQSLYWRILVMIHVTTRTSPPPLPILWSV